MAGGSIVVPQAGSEPQRARPSSGAAPRAEAPGDVVHADDLIVQGSICAGFDCVNDESFGFDTIRLKENNTRIGFDDTSVGAFPANDWQLVANDSPSGGASRFSIEDITGAKIPFTVRAGAPTNSLFVDSSGRVGFRTGAPVLDLHVVTSNTPAMRLDQDGSGGFTPQVWDIAGNEANFFVRDVTGGSRLPFRIRPGAPTSSLDVAANGNVGIGTSSPTSRLHVASAGEVVLRLQNLGGMPSSWDLRNNVDTGRLTFTDDTTNARVPFKFGLNAANNLLRVGVGATNQVDINGNLVVFGTITPDYVFDPAYDLESIDEHAESMWTNRHLPALTPAETTAEGKGVVNVGERSQAMLEELEKAHIYIAQLHERVKDLTAAVAARESAVVELRHEVEAIKERLAN